MDFIDDLRRTVTRAAEELAAFPEETAARRPAPGKWSAKEIVGHLVDSAANNHQRFVRAQFQEDLVFSGYAQDAWVAVQGYQDAPWRDLLVLWREYNLHIARVMARVPEEVRLRLRHRHNLHQLASRAVQEDQPATLEYLMRDYVRHLHHHLAQLRALGVLRDEPPTAGAASR